MRGEELKREQRARALQQRAKEEGIDSSMLVAPYSAERLASFSRILANHVECKERIDGLYARARVAGYTIKRKLSVPYSHAMLNELEEEIEKAEQDQKDAQLLVSLAQKVCMQSESVAVLQDDEIARHALRGMLKPQEEFFQRFDQLELRIQRLGADRIFSIEERIALGEEGLEAEQERLREQKDLFQRFHQLWGAQIPEELSVEALYPLSEEKLAYYQMQRDFDQKWRQTFYQLGRALPANLRRELPVLPALITAEHAPRILMAYKSLQAQSHFFGRAWGALKEFVHWRVARNTPNPVDLLDINVHSARALLRIETELLDLSGLVQLDASSARVLCAFQGDTLCLDGLQSIDERRMSILSRWSGNSLSLNGLRSLDAGAAHHLTRWGGNYLYLNGLKSITDETAEILAGWKGGYLALDGLRHLDVHSARALIARLETRKYISLMGLVRMDIEVAHRLEPFTGLLGLEPSGFTPAVQEILKGT